MAAYATTADLTAFVGAESGVTLPVQAESDRMLARASNQIDAALIGSFYATDVNGLPTDANQIAALNNATCSQVEYWLATGDELGLNEEYGIIEIGSIKLNKATRSPLTKPRRSALCSRAIDYLRLGGLWPTQPVVW